MCAGRNKSGKTVFRIFHFFTVEVLRAAARCVSILPEISKKEKHIAFVFKFLSQFTDS